MANVTADQFGRWTCKVQFTDVATFRVAHFTVMTGARVTDVRLPRHLLPERYAVHLTPFLIVGNFTIPGHVEIKIHVVQSGSKNITLHVHVGHVVERKGTARDDPQPSLYF